MKTDLEKLLTILGIEDLDAEYEAIVNPPTPRIQPVIEKLPVLTDVSNAKTWTSEKILEKGDLVSYEGKFYKVKRRHLSLSAWTPSKTPALFEEVLEDEQTIPKK